MTQLAKDVKHAKNYAVLLELKNPIIRPCHGTYYDS